MHTKLLTQILPTMLIGSLGSASAALVANQTVGIDFASANPAFGAASGGTSGNFIEFSSSLADGATSGVVTLTQDLTGAAVAGVSFTVTNNLGKDASLTSVASNDTMVPAPFTGAEIFDDSWGGANVGSTTRADAGALANGANIVIFFAGLDDSLTYDLTGGGNFVNNNFDTIWTSGATTATTDNGTTPFVTLSDLSTDGAGNLSVTVEREAVQLFIAAVTLTANAPMIPEPSSSLLMGLGLLAGLARRRR